MTSEMSEKSYQAVRCSSAAQKLIPLSTRLSHFFVAESDRPTELPCRDARRAFRPSMPSLLERELLLEE